MLDNKSKIIKGEMLLSQANPQSMAGKILLFPLTRIVIAILFLSPVTIIHFLFESEILPMIPESYKAFAIGFDVLIGISLFLILYKLYTKYIEKRKALEFSFTNGLKESLLGLVLGGGLITILVLFLASLGYYKIGSLSADWTIIFKGVFSIGMAAFVEELFFRLIIFKLTEEFCGSWIALVTSVIYFGFAHAGNPNATLWTSVAVGVEAGVLLTAAYMLTRTIWFPLMIHFGWNYFQAKIFGVTTSGITIEGLIIPSIEGPEWITGGAFGIEASVVAVLLCLVVAVIILKKAVQSNQIIAPIWQGKRLISDSGLSPTV
ncbi:MAG: CPBP family intramembrane metalloprotease [candidate division Zixibacteria bacterium]|nr:CPBP family intramembrane metalloprotease [candidate division Zixibacteria bacterium]